MELSDEKRQVKEWLEAKYNEWRLAQGDRRKESYRELASRLVPEDDVPRFENLISKWLNYKTGATPTGANVVILANKFGPELYDLVGWPRPNCYEEG